MAFMPSLSPRIDQIPASGIRRIFELALVRPDTIMLAVGEPIAPPPVGALAAGADTWTAADVRYTANGGIEPIRYAIAQKLARENALDVPIDQICLTTGGTQALSRW